jgi:Flp pilus assembly CpaE family ATPase
MAAAALAGRLAQRRNGARAAARASDGPLAFHGLGGPLVAVCGLTGGAGASTLAYLLARRAAPNSSGPVLVAELGAAGGLAALAGRASPLGLAELAQAASENASVTEPFAQLEHDLRLVASAPRPETPPATAEALSSLLRDARAAHGLVIVDTGPPGPHADVVLDAASHVLYVMPTSEPALRRAQLLARGGLFATSRGRPSTLVANAVWPGRRISTRQLRALAEPHLDRLLLVPHTPALLAGSLEPAFAALEDTFTDLDSILRGGR